ncbi:MAG: ECF transporter S component, partial [Bacteroidales bacterium]
MQQTAKLYSYSYREYKTYLFSVFFIGGNIILPQLCHLIPNGGLIFLPIYFFTLIAAYKYGITVGVLTA